MAEGAPKVQGQVRLKYSPDDRGLDNEEKEGRKESSE